jgi:hypothetical protein
MYLNKKARCLEEEVVYNRFNLETANNLMGKEQNKCTLVPAQKNSFHS